MENMDLQSQYGSKWKRTQRFTQGVLEDIDPKMG